MSKKHEILQKMIQEMPFRFPMEIEPYVLEAMDIFAKAVAEDALKRAAENAKIDMVYEQLGHDPRPLSKFIVDKQSILSTEINLELC